MAKLPAMVRVGPATYRVTSDAAEHAKACQRVGDGLLGSTTFKSCVITIDPDQAHDCKTDTVLHEVLHCVTQMAGLLSEWGEEKDEAVVTRLTPVLLGVIRDNPDLISYLKAPR